MSIRWLPHAVTLAAVLMLAVISPAVNAEVSTVTMADTLNFTPATLVIHVGDTVKWKNTSVLTHTVTDVPSLAAKADDANLPDGAKAFNSGYLDPGKTFSHTFTVPGTYRYFCIPHEAAGMVATVIVKLGK